MNAFLGCFGIIMFPETVCKDLEINTAGNADVVFFGIQNEYIVSYPVAVSHFCQSL